MIRVICFIEISLYKSRRKPAGIDVQLRGVFLKNIIFVKIVNWKKVLYRLLLNSKISPPTIQNHIPSHLLLLFPENEIKRVINECDKFRGNPSKKVGNKRLDQSCGESRRYASRSHLRFNDEKCNSPGEGEIFHGRIFRGDGRFRLINAKRARGQLRPPRLPFSHDD